MRRIFLIALIAFAIPFTSLAIPAKKMWRTVSQPDGTTLKLMLIGDERLSYFITDDSVPVLEHSGSYYYADGIGFGMKRSNLLAHESNARTPLESKTARLASANRIESLRPFFNTRLFRPTHPITTRMPLRKSASGTPFYTSDHRDITGKHKSILILAEFKDRKFYYTHDSTYYWNMVNQEGYTNSQGAIGSVHDYFYEQSNGQLDLTFDVVGPIELDYDYSHYGGANSTYFQNGDNSWEFAYEAITKADSINTDLNWADYDWDGDGEVENLYIIYAGYGEATGGSSNTLWPAQTNFDDYNAYYPQMNFPEYHITLDGVKINTFAYGNELYGSIGSLTPQGMGTMTHEFSHCLGYPDLYVTDYSGGIGMDIWSIMATGSYGGPNGIGWVPTGYTAYEKWAAGWIDYKEFNVMNDSVVGLRSTRNGGNAYVIYNDQQLADANPDALEYFLLENRTKDGWDTYLPAQGLEVMRVNYVKNVWEMNAVNTPAAEYGGNGRYNMTVIPANNNTSRSSNPNALFPYNDKDSITVNSSPSLTFFNAQRDGTTTFRKPIRNITWNDSDSTVSFFFNPVDTMFTPAPSIYGAPIQSTSNSNTKQFFIDSARVTIETELGEIRYSTDSVHWKDYIEPFYVTDDTTTVYAYAWRQGKDTSNVTVVRFIKLKKLEAPIINGDTVFIGSTKVSITASRGRIRYARDKKNSFRDYRSPLEIRRSTTVYTFARAEEEGYLNSDTVSMSFRRIEKCSNPNIALSADSGYIEISTTESNGNIFVSSDSLEFAEYLAPIQISSDSVTIWSYVAAEGKLNSDTVSYTYLKKPIVNGISNIRNGIISGEIQVYTLDGKSIHLNDIIDKNAFKRDVYIVVDNKGKSTKVFVK